MTHPFVASDTSPSLGEEPINENERLTPQPLPKGEGTMKNADLMK